MAFRAASRWYFGGYAPSCDFLDTQLLQLKQSGVESLLTARVEHPRLGTLPYVDPTERAAKADKLKSFYRIIAAGRAHYGPARNCQAFC
jgi:hypothetical protein